ncbi:MAG TPA: iron-containing alcohol dehydrogenase family protein [Candidatus Limnocylindrales bacterium]|nr:iron-containing alcohol dehydrogenase family protein [Candidatus Limnocylindrales bacterium]
MNNGIDIFLSPQRYIQRKNLLEEAGSYLSPLGKRPFVVGDDIVFSKIRTPLTRSCREAGLDPHFERFGGECDQAEVDRLTILLSKGQWDILVGTGGGKSLDTCRLVRASIQLPFVTIPTSSATCSAASASAVLYENHIRKRVHNGNGADLTLVDPEIIAKAPPRLFAAGLADALAKWYEGRVVFGKIQKDIPSRISLELSERARNLILDKGVESFQDVKKGLCTPVVEEMIEVTILLTGIISGLGSKMRVAGAHALYYGLGVLEETRQAFHGEIVGLGILVQLLLEKREQEVKPLMEFFSRLELPLTLGQIGLGNVSLERLKLGLEATCKEGSSIHNLPFPVHVKDLQEALLTLDTWGKALLDSPSP